MSYQEIALLLLVGSFVVLSMGWLIPVIINRPQVALVVGLILTLASSSQFGHPNLRLGIALMLVPHLGRACQAARRGRAGKLPSLTLPIVYTILAAVSVLWSLDPGKTLVSTSAWIVLLLYIFTFRTLVDAGKIRSMTFYVLLVFFIASLISLATPLGWEGGRAQGVFNNANAAGIYAFLLLGISFWMGRKSWLWILPASVFFIFATGSRASLLATVTMLVAFILFKAPHRYRFPLGVIIVAAGIPLGIQIMAQIQRLGAADTSVLRTNNSREKVWDLAFDFIQENPLLGAGYRATPEKIGSSSYIKLFAEFGLIFGLIGLVLAVGYVWWSRHDPVMLGITAGTLVNTAFEDWLLTAGGPMLIIYLLLLFSTPQKSISTTDRNLSGEFSFSSEDDSREAGAVSSLHRLSPRV